MSKGKNKEPKYNHEELLKKEISAKAILDKWDYAGTDSLEKSIREFRDNNPSDTREMKDIINQIVLW